jgi:hypothetical protein
MIENNDWRLNVSKSQKDYLQGKSLKCVSIFVVQIEDWDHEHCEFCLEKFDTSYGGCFYHTVDKKIWICQTCFNDFKKIFKWIVTE